MLPEMFGPGAGLCLAFFGLALLFLQQRFFDAAVQRAVQREVGRIEKKMSRKHAAEIAGFKSWAEDLTLQVQQALGAAHSCSCADANTELGRLPRVQREGAGTQSPSCPSHDSEH